MDKLIEELAFTNKWIPANEKDSKWYREYIDKICEKLKTLSKNTLK